LALTLGNANSSVTVWEENEKRVVLIREHFEAIDDLFLWFWFDATCTNPKRYNQDRFQLLSNGSLFLPRSNVSTTTRLLTFKNFCIIPRVRLNTMFFLVSNVIFLKVKPDDDEFQADVCLLEKLKDKDARYLLRVFLQDFYPQGNKLRYIYVRPSKNGH